MTLIERIKRLFHIGEKADNDIEPIETTDVSIIDTSNLEIDRNLTDDENESRKKLFEEVSSGNFSTFITYGNDIAKRTNHYMDIIRKRLNQNIEENKTLSRNVSLEQAIRQKVKIIFNDAEIDSILSDLSELKRNCELRIIALEDLGNVELKKSKRRIFFMSDKTDASKINSINNAIFRLSAHIKIITMLSQSVRNEQLTYYNENNTLNTFLSNTDEKESKEIANRVLDETFKELKSSIKAIATFSNIPALVIDGESLDKLDMDKMPLDKKVEVIALSKRYLDLYVAENREKLLAPGGLLDRAKEYQSKLWKEIESDYLDVPLWAKKAFKDSITKSDKSIYPNIKNKVYHKYYERLNNIERLVSVFGEEIPEEFKEKFYKTKFYYYALYEETDSFDSKTSAPFKIKSEEERKYYLKFITEIVDKIHRESDDGELLKFMDKHLSLKNANDILDHYDKFVALLRIEKLGRDGLFTLSFYKAEFKNYSPYCCCLDQINPKYLSKADLQIDLHYLGTMAKDILKLWKSTNNLEKMYNGFWGDYNDCWEFAEKVNPALYPRSNPSNWNWVYDNDLDYWPFVIKTIKEYNKSAREKGVDFEKQFNSFMGYKLNNGQYLAMFAYLMEKFSHNQFSREDVLSYIKNINRITEYGIMTNWILEDYLKENLSKENFEYFNYKYKKAPFSRVSRLNLWKTKKDDIRQFEEDKTLDFDFYKFIVNSCKKFESISWENNGKACGDKYSMDDTWMLVDACFKLDKIFGKENVRDELLNKYSYEYMKKDSSGDFIMLNKEKDIKTVIHFNFRNDSDDIDNIIRSYIFNKLVDKQIISDDKYLKAAMWMAYNFMSEAAPSSPFRDPILSEPFRGNLIGYYSNSMEVYISGKKKNEYISEDEKKFLKETEVVRIPLLIKVPESVQNKFDINERMTTLLENSNNVKQLICPDLVRVVLADNFDQRVRVVLVDNFDQRVRRSLDENNRVRPEILFEEYRKDAEVEDDRKNTAKSDGDMDL